MPRSSRATRAMFAAGFRRGDLVHNCFSYHFTPAGSMLETGAHALGCPVFPGGIGQTEQQVQAMVMRLLALPAAPAAADLTLGMEVRAELVRQALEAHQRDGVADPAHTIPAYAGIGRKR